MDTSIARERSSYVLKPDSITASQGDFLATHVAINRLHLFSKFDDVLPSGGKNISEEEVFNQYILNPNNQHQFIAVYGQSGTGKSHLIRWFEARFEQEKPDDEVILFIRRSDNTLKGTIRQLLEKPEVQKIANREVYDRLIKANSLLDEKKLKDIIYHNFIVEVHNDNDTHSISIPFVKRRRLEAFLNNEDVHEHLMSENGPIERMYSKLSEHTLVDRDTIAQFLPEDFYVSSDLYDSLDRADQKAEKMALRLMSEEGKETAELLASYLNQFVNEVIQRCAGIEPGDFRQIFQDIRKELYRIGKNLTLFIEDVTSFTGVDDALLDALIVEHTGMNAEDNLCRISSIVGTTSNYLQNNFHDNHKDRITQYVYIPSDVFDENGIYEFVGRYINAMSLSKATISSWLKNQANPEDYPVHEVKQGKNWDYISLKYGKKLCLYPFTKNSIKYLYNHELNKGHQTPRYIIRDIIEPVVNDILYNPDNFPSIECPLINVDTALSYGIHNQVKDDNAANRLLKFLWIWGNGQPEQYTKDGTTYISAISEAILSELGLPVISFSEVDEPINSDTNYLKQNEISEPVQDERKINKIPLSVKERVSKVNSVLTDWSNGQAINISQTGGVMGSIKKAQDDICSYLLSSINWQAEGIPNDNINKVKRSSSKIKLVSLENQTKGNGFYVLPASWDSMNVISAFVRWREYGMQSWNYPDSDFDAYLITSWSSQIKNDVIKAISDKADPLRISYIEAAVTAEMYQLILRGEFTGNSLEKLSVKSLFNSTFSQCEENNHCKEWNELLKLLSRYDSGNRKTIRQYFNIIQGPDEAKVVILNEPELARIVKKVKANKLNVVEEDLQLDDQVTLRQKVFENLKIISDRINSVANAEIVKAKAAMKIIYDQFDSDEIEEEDILDLVDASKKFYSEINNAQINIPVASTDAVKKSAKQIAKVTSKIGEVLLNNDVLVILMTFSGDPLSTLQPLIELLDVLNKDVRKLDQRLAVKETSLKRRQEGEDSENQYSIEQNMIATDISIAENLR